MIKLDRALCVFDLEATGVDPLNDRIVDVCVLRREPDGQETVFSELVDPGVPIPPEAASVHGITDAMVAGRPSFKDLAPRLLAALAGADLSGFNAVKYDVPLLAAEFKRVGVDWPAADVRVVDSFVLFSRKQPRDLGAAYAFYCGKSLAGAHRAEADTRAAAEVLWAQLDRYPDLPRDVPGLQAWCAQRKPNDSRVDEEGKFAWRHGEAVFAFGNKHKGKTLREVARADPGYLTWMAEKGSFRPDVAAICREALKGNFPRKDP
ncbi:MAG: 3'-5' exonuclease [Elusimicrobia bacterium]|nr:3'-5' exonuclease [Elusimicrobiota bacterium]